MTRALDLNGFGLPQPSTPLVFLDIDDVLCLSAPYGGFDALAAVRKRHGTPAAVYQTLFAPTAVSALERVHRSMEEQVRYVISSTWRESFHRHQLENVFRRSGLEFVADNLVEGELWRTPSKLRLGRRADEIAQWLDQHHQVEPFVIIDDNCSGASLRPALEVRTGEPPHPFVDRVVLCQEDVGLTDAHVPFIVDALRREPERPGRRHLPSAIEAEQP